MNTQRVTIAIENLSCAAEGARITRALEAVRGVVYAYVNPLTEMTYVEYDPVLCAATQLQDTIAQLGFQTEVPSLR